MFSVISFEYQRDLNELNKAANYLVFINNLLKEIVHPQKKC